MGTKQNPGKFDCYANALPDEPMFVLLARDPNAWWLVMLWAYQREMMGEKPEMVREAFLCAMKMRTWLIENRGRDPMEWLLRAANKDSMFEDLSRFVESFAGVPI